MKQVWMKREGTPRLVLFFNGWGMDERAVSHVAGTSDVLEVHDYRQLDDHLPAARDYDTLHVVAWSMGVWAASVLVDAWGLSPSRAVAINGTGAPVDDLHGIPTRVYTLTERAMNEHGRALFMGRMLSSPDDVAWFRQHTPRRPLDEVVEELHRIREQAASRPGGFPWHLALVSTADVIFPPVNQCRWWEHRVPVHSIPGGHYPFRQLTDWDKILAHGNQ